MSNPIDSNISSPPVKQPEQNKKALILTSVALGATLGAVCGIPAGPVGIVAGAIAGAVAGIFYVLASLAFNALNRPAKGDAIHEGSIIAIDQPQAQKDKQLATIHSAAVDLYLSSLDKGEYDNKGPFREGGLEESKKEMSSLTDPLELKAKVQKKSEENDSHLEFLTDFIKNPKFEELLSLPIGDIEQARQLIQKATEPDGSEGQKQLISELKTIFQNQSQTRQNAQGKFLLALKATIDNGKTKMDANALAVTPGIILSSKLVQALAKSSKPEDMMLIASMSILTQFIIENAEAIVPAAQPTAPAIVLETGLSPAEQKLNALRDDLIRNSVFSERELSSMYPPVRREHQ